MDYNILLDTVTDLGYRLSMSGAETFRVEESVNRILGAYGLASEAFALPNCLIVSIETAEGKPMTRMRRVDMHGNNLDAVERYSNLSRQICLVKPEPQEAAAWLHQAEAAMRHYPLPLDLLGHGLATGGFAYFFGASLTDSLCAVICGCLAGFVNRLMDKVSVNPFFRTIISAFLMAFVAYTASAAGISSNPDTVIIGALMILVPGLLFTNAMRDIIFGDTNSGIIRIVQVFLIAAAIALGTGAAWHLAIRLWQLPAIPEVVPHSVLLQCVGSFVGCVGFSFIFNIHGKGCLLCVFGGVFSWAIYCAVIHFGGDELAGYFAAALSTSAYAEIMARLRKYPAISYLVVSLFPLFPGAGIYYTTTYIARGDMSGFAVQGGNTIAIAAVMAVGILLVSTAFRSWSVWLHRKRK